MSASLCPLVSRRPSSSWPVFSACMPSPGVIAPTTGFAVIGSASKNTNGPAPPQCCASTVRWTQSGLRHWFTKALPKACAAVGQWMWMLAHDARTLGIPFLQTLSTCWIRVDAGARSRRQHACRRIRAADQRRCSPGNAAFWWQQRDSRHTHQGLPIASTNMASVYGRGFGAG